MSGNSNTYISFKSGVLKVGTTGDFPGWSFKNPATDEYEGFDIDVAKALAADMGVEIEFVPTDWKNLVSGVVANKYYMTSNKAITNFIINKIRPKIDIM